MCRPYQTIDIINCQHTLPYKNKNVLHQKHIVEGLSIRQIASQFLSSKESIRCALHEFGIAVREKSKPHGRLSQLKFGQKRIQGDVKIYKKEGRVILLAKQMRCQGLSLRQIASNLSTMSIPTKCNGLKWHPQMVKRIIEIDNYKKY